MQTTRTTDLATFLAELHALREADRQAAVVAELLVAADWLAWDDEVWLHLAGVDVSAPSERIA